MVLLTLSPRCCAAEGFDIIYNPFNQYLYDSLSKEKDW